jgi:WD40 repeat protein
MGEAMCGELRAFLDNELGWLGSLRMRLHLRRCPVCQQAKAEHERLDALLAQAAQVSASARLLTAWQAGMPTETQLFSAKRHARSPGAMRRIVVVGAMLTVLSVTGAMIRRFSTSAATIELTGHSAAVTSVAFSPNGKGLASGSLDGTIKLWDVQMGRLTHTLTLSGHKNLVLSVVFSPDGKTLASASSDATVRIWDAQTGQLMLTLMGHSGDVSCVAFSPDGRTLASGSNDSIVRLWDAQTGNLKQALKGHATGVRCVVFSPDGRTLASASNDKTIRFWDAQTGEVKRTLTGHDSPVASVAFSPDGKFIASGSGDVFSKGELRLWMTQTGKLKWTAILPDVDEEVELYDLQAGKATLKQTLEKRGATVWSVAFSPDGKKIASGSDDMTIRVWDAETGHSMQTLRGHKRSVVSVAFSCDGKTVASGSWDSTVRLWDTSRL